MSATLRALFLFIILCHSYGAEINYKEELLALKRQFNMLKTKQAADLLIMRHDVAELKGKCVHTDNHARNEQATLEWAKTSMKEVRSEIKELSANINNSELLKQLQDIRNELKQALTETSELEKLTRMLEARVDKMDNEIERLKYEDQQTMKHVAEVRSHVSKIQTEMKPEDFEEVHENDVLPKAPLRHDHHRHRRTRARHIRHSKMVHSQISRLSRSQDQLDQYQQGLQTQILDVQRRLDRYEESNWNLLSAKVDVLEIEAKTFRDQIANVTQKVSDFDKLHVSLLELRETIEGAENKADKIIPEFRKEISKLDIDIAQLNAQASYLKEDQDGLRQSVKAIAVSVSNTIDRSDMDRQLLQKINDTIVELQTTSKQHFYRLNDHILKSEANHQINEANLTETISLPELIGEVKELQPVEREYEDLVNQLPKDCSTVRGPPGTYLLHPGPVPVDVWCVDGSTVLQRRVNGSVEFNRKFREYVHGFGDPAGEFWLGLENMHRITADNCSSMRIDMTDIYGGSWYAQYEYFSVGNADGGYVLEVSGFQGNASDAFEYQNHMEFSAVDRDRDIANTHCAVNYEGGWWFSHCQHVNINGKYTLGLTWFDSARNEWIAVATSEMRTFRRPGCT